MRIIITGVGPSKVKIIKIIREATGLDLKETKDIADNIEKGIPYSLENLSELDARRIESELITEGATIRYEQDEIDFFSEDESNKPIETTAEEDKESDEQLTVETTECNTENTDGNRVNSTKNMYIPPVASNKVHLLDRQGTLRVLKEAGKIATEFEKLESDISSLIQRIKSETQNAEALRKVISPKAKTMRWAVTIIAFIIGLFGNLLCIVTGIAAYVIMTMTVVKADLESHKDENNANADAYLREHVNPLKSQLNDLYAQRDEYLHNGSRDWAISVVGKDFFYSACIKDLYKLVEGHRADNLKEALNQYDDALYKARMEEMQASIQNATEISAAESVKQTEYAKQTAKSSKQTATASKATAVHTRAIYKNTRNSRK
ncbi:MAG: ribosomal protein L7/L12 [Lachnospiraceae bacterium]|nr:ribosomal protein L7/L12 [Lachnospiraceae bacterium]